MIDLLFCQTKLSWYVYHIVGVVVKLFKKAFTVFLCVSYHSDTDIMLCLLFKGRSEFEDTC